MEEENQVQQELQQVQQIMKEPQGKAVKAQRVTTKDPKNVEAGKRLAAINRKKREAKKREEQVQLERTAIGANQYYGIGAVIALGVIGGLGYYIYPTKKGEVPDRALQAPAPRNPSQQPRQQAIVAQLPSGAQPAQTNKFEMD